MTQQDRYRMKLKQFAASEQLTPRDCDALCDALCDAACHAIEHSNDVALNPVAALTRVGRPSAQITGVGGSIVKQACAVGQKDLLIAIRFPPDASDTLMDREHLVRLAKVAGLLGCRSPASSVWCCCRSLKAR